MTTASLVLTGKNFLVQQGARAFEPVVAELLNEAESEIHVMAYVISPSAAPFLAQLEHALNRGVAVSVMVNALEAHDQRILALLREMNRYPHYVLTDFSAVSVGVLHAKVVISDRRRALIGSANFTWGGFVANHEVGVLIEGNAAWQLAKIFDRTNHLPAL